MARSGIGTTLAFGTSTTYTPEIRSLGGMTMTREMFDCTHMASPAGTIYPGVIWKEYEPGDLADPGQLNMGILFDPDKMPSAPFDKEPEELTMTFRPIVVGGVLQTTPATCVFQGFVVSLSQDINYDGLIEGQAVVQISGEPLWTAGAA